MQDFKVTLHASSGDMDVTGASTFALTDLTAGSMNLNEFTAATDHGGDDAAHRHVCRRQ